MAAWTASRPVAAGAAGVSAGAPEAGDGDGVGGRSGDGVGDGDGAGATAAAGVGAGGGAGARTPPLVAITNVSVETQAPTAAPMATRVPARRGRTLGSVDVSHAAGAGD